MPDLQTLLGELNGAFGGKGISRLANNSDAFAPGKSLGSGLIVTKDSPLFEQYQRYLGLLPGSIQETLRSVMYYALCRTDEKGKSKPTHITFAWQPGYDFKIIVTEVGDTTRTRGGITIVIESPYDKKSLLPRDAPPNPPKPPKRRK